MHRCTGNKLRRSTPNSASQTPILHTPLASLSRPFACGHRRRPSHQAPGNTRANRRSRARFLFRARPPPLGGEVKVFGFLLAALAVQLGLDGLSDLDGGVGITAPSAGTW